MKYIFKILGVLIYSFISAQTTITKSVNDPVAGDVVNNVVVVGTVDNSATGSGVTFSNASLTGGPAAPTLYYAPTSTEIASFPSSNLKRVDGLTSTFLKSSSTQLEITAIVSPDLTLNFSANNATIMKYPTSFGNSFTDQAQGTFTSSTASGLLKGTITSNADASGTLIVGTKTYPNILRIKMVQNFNLHSPTDTFFLFPIGNFTATNYIYYDNIRKFPLLSHTASSLSVPSFGINENSNGATALDIVFLGTKEFVKNEFSVFPNPTQDFINIKGNQKFEFAEIFSADGKLLKTLSIYNQKLDVSYLLPGSYVLQISTKDRKKETVFFIKK